MVLLLPNIQCDFCLNQDWKYTHYCDRFEIANALAENQAYVDDGQWAVCAECHPLVLARDAARLLARAQERNAETDFKVDEELFQVRLIDAFFEHYHGAWDERE